MCPYLHNNYETLLCWKLPQAHEFLFFYKIKNLYSPSACVILALLHLYQSCLFSVSEPLIDKRVAFSE